MPKRKRTGRFAPWSRAYNWATRLLPVREDCNVDEHKSHVATMAMAWHTGYQAGRADSRRDKED
jgi:hypothetical protein